MIAIRSLISSRSGRSWVMNHGEAELVAQLGDLPKDLALHENVESRRGLVHDHQLGRRASAIAIITRCRMPPDSSCG
jgi:hypothetical protein